MDFNFTAEQEEFRKEVRGFLEEELRPEKVARYRDPKEEHLWSEEYTHMFNRMLGEKGWYGMSWPAEYGGLGKDFAFASILGYEVARAGGPSSGNGPSMVGPSLMLFGSEEQKNFFLPKIAKGEIYCCQGYSEPGAGTDLASLQCRAVADGDDFVINGQKIFTTNAHISGWVWLATRTDPSAPKHRGISMFLVDMKLPGVQCRPLWTLPGWRHNEVFFDDVRVPKTALVGELNRGWYHIATAMNFERSGYGYYGQAERHFEDLLRWCKDTKIDGVAVADDPVVQDKLAQLFIDLSTGIRFVKRVAWMQSQKNFPDHEASMNKMWGTELVQRIDNVGMQIMGLYGQLTWEDEMAPMQGDLAYSYLNNMRISISGGTNEIQRDIIARRGFGMPR